MVSVRSTHRPRHPLRALPHGSVSARAASLRADLSTPSVQATGRCKPGLPVA